jgi:molybdenum cofactor cytidylyltransferase
LRRTLQAVAALTRNEVLVVLPRHAARYRVEARGLNVAFVPNLRRAEGLSSSVRRAIAHSRFSRAVLLLPVDLPGLQRRDLARLVSRWRAGPRRVAATRLAVDEAAPRGVAPQGNGGVRRAGVRRDGVAHGGVPLILPRWLYARALHVGGDKGLRDLVGSLPVHQRVLVDLASAAVDIDTPHDLRMARRRLRHSSFSP